MSLFDFEPSVRAVNIARCRALSVPISAVIRLSEARRGGETADLFEVLSIRTSTYRSNSLKIDDVSDLLWHCFIGRNFDTGGNHRRTNRPYPSAGGLNSVHLLIQNISAIPGVWIYRPESHALALIDMPEETASELKNKAAACLPIAPATLIWLCADVESISDKYANYESLLLREAGFILSSLTLVGTAFGWFPVALGVMGGPVIAKMIPWTSAVEGVGALHISA